MEGQREVINDFAELVNDKVFKTINQDISFDSLNKCKQLLILQTAPIYIVQNFIDKLILAVPDIEITIIGNNACEGIKGNRPINVKSIVEHNGYFSDNDINLVKDSVNAYKINGIVFFNNFVNSVDFTNIEHILTFITNISVFSYSYVQAELNEHKNLNCQIYGKILYKNLVEWVKTI